MKTFLTIVLLVMAMPSFSQKVAMGTAQKTYDLHFVMKGETLYSVSKKFNTTVGELLKLNPDIVNNNLQEGKMIRVPVSKTPLEESASVNRPKPEKPILHEVSKGETVFSISKKYDTNVETILMWNNLSEPAINVGQKIIVGYETPKLAVVGPLTSDHENNVSKEESQASKTNKTVETLEDHAKSESGGSTMMKYYSERGIAAWSKSTYDDGNFYAMHVDAPKGTEIVIKNLMNNKTVRVKVIGKLPATAENENVMIRISESAAKQLNALDEKFLVEISYSVEELVSISGTN